MSSTHGFLIFGIRARHEGTIVGMYGETEREKSLCLARYEQEWKVSRKCKWYAKFGSLFSMNKRRSWEQLLNWVKDGFVGCFEGTKTF